MYNKSIRIELPKTVICSIDATDEIVNGFRLFAFAAEILTDYILNHYMDFEHYNKYSSRDCMISACENNIMALKEKLCNGKIDLPKPDGVFIEKGVIDALQKKCPYAVLETAVRRVEEYRIKKSAFYRPRKNQHGTQSLMIDDCVIFRIRNLKEVLRKKSLKIPCVVDGHLFGKEIEIFVNEVSIPESKNINLDESFALLSNDRIIIETHPVKFVTKPYYYSLQDVVTMGVDLGTINDATCAILNNKTGKVVYKQIYIDVKEEILRLQTDYKSNACKNYRNEIENHINVLVDMYQRKIAEDICSFALENKVEYVFFEGLFEQKCKGAAMTLWDPKAMLEKVYEKLHNAGIAYQSVSPVYTSRYYAGGGVVDRIVTDRSKAFSPDGKLIDADKNAALNILARGMIDLYFDSLPEEVLISVIKNNSKLLRCNEIIYDDLITLRRSVNDRIDTNTVFKRQRYFNKTKAVFCKKHGIE